MAKKQMTQELKDPKEKNLKEELDYWVKDFEEKIEKTKDIDLQVSENTQNIDYNYELIKNLQKEIDKLKKDIEEIKHFNFIALKSRPLKSMDE